MAALATEAKALMDVDPWLPPEPPHPPGGTRLPHLFGALAHQRMTDLVRGVTAGQSLAPSHSKLLRGACVLERPTEPKNDATGALRSLGMSALLRGGEEYFPAQYWYFTVSARYVLLNSQDPQRVASTCFRSTFCLARNGVPPKSLMG